MSKAELETRLDAAMREVGFEASADQPEIVTDNQRANVFYKEYSHSGFKYLVVASERDIAQMGMDAVVAMKVRMATATRG